MSEPRPDLRADEIRPALPPGVALLRPRLIRAFTLPAARIAALLPPRTPEDRA